MGALKYYNTATSSWEYIDQPGGANSFIYKEAISGVNGTATAFTTARGYVGGTLEVFVNGIAQGPTHISETNPSLGQFSLDVAPSGIVTVNYQINIPPAGNADTVDGYHANVTPTANTIPVLDGNAKLLSTLLDYTGKSSLGGSGYIIIDGIQIVWGSGTSSSAGVQFTFAKAFSGEPWAILTDVYESSSGANGSFIRGKSSTAVTIKTSTADNRQVYWLAIGPPS